jgi:hypothetical protein
MQSNQTAAAFWRRAIAAFAGVAIEPVCFEKDGTSWLVFSFAS